MTKLFKKHSIVFYLWLISATVLVAIAGRDPMKETVNLFRSAMSGMNTVSTGVVALGYDTVRSAEFREHTMKGMLYSNGLYQGFLAVAYDELDTLRTYHSSVGRTNARRFPGDSNTFRFIARSPKISNTRIDSQMITFSLPGRESNLRIRQLQYAYKDSGHIIYLSLVFEFYRRNDTDTVRFSHFRLMLGYDGDIGSSLSGYTDDSCGYFADDTVKAVYVFDHPDTGSVFYSGIRYLGGGLSDSAGNLRLMHQTVNEIGRTFADLDTYLYTTIQNPGFNPLYQKTDVTVYWIVNLGDIIPASKTDTVRDTVRFAFINGRTYESFIQSVRGLNVRYDDPELPPAVIPSRYKLYPNYPNPFNGGTAIQYDLPQNGLVSLKIYNALGQEVRTLVSKWQGKGVYTVNWDSRDNQGSTVAGGLYLYRLTAGSYTAVRKMMLIK